MKTKATLLGIEEARALHIEFGHEVALQCLQPGQEAPDSALFYALTREEIAKLFGVKFDTKAYRNALDEYNRAFIAEIYRLTHGPQK